MSVKGYVQKISMAIKKRSASEEEKLMLGKLLTETIASKESIMSLSDVEFKVFSQWGDDGIIQWLIRNLDIQNKIFVEFGVGNYRESNTRFLMMNNNWSGLVMDSSKRNVAQIVNSEYFWKYTLLALAAFIDVDNINSLLSSTGLDKDVGLLHIDLDGNDYWVWREITNISPTIVILEYNSLFGIDRSITVPYDSLFQRTREHYSNLYFGASLRALCQLSAEKGYSFIGCNSAGNNAYFVRNDKINNKVGKVSPEKGFEISKFRESRDKKGQLTYLTRSAQLDTIRGLPVYNIDTNEMEEL
jgi:hypothetical protein